MNLNHAHLGTKDLKKSVEFYSSVFGFTKKFDHEPGVFLENGDGFLLAIDPVDEVPHFPSWFHLGFCLNSEAEVHEVYRNVKDRYQIARDMKSENGQFASFFILDPDGFRIEVSWHST
jgi:catechol 2,3-dioxygenase-like lactoylglutathione lyase family enzyme